MLPAGLATTTPIASSDEACRTGTRGVAACAGSTAKKLPNPQEPNAAGSKHKVKQVFPVVLEEDA